MAAAPPASPARAGAHSWFSLLVVLVALSAIVWAHARSDLTFPLPWPDESAFLYQSAAFATHGSLFAPELNPEHTVRWMPPGYMLLTGVAFRATSVSIPIARFVSLLCAMAAFVCITALLHRAGAADWTILLCAAAMLTAPMVAMANIARMEALVLLGAGCAFLGFARGARWWPVALLALLPLAHPNGVFFFGAGLLLAWHEGVFHARPRGWSLALVVATLLAWAVYGVDTLLHWSTFVADIVPLVIRKVDRPPSPWGLASGALAIVAFVGARIAARRAHASRTLWAFATAAAATHALGQEIWYVPYAVIAGVAVVGAWDALVRTHGSAVTHRRVLFGVLALVAVLLVLPATRDTALRPWVGSWAGMQVPPSIVPYVTADDAVRVRDWLRAHAATHPTVGFYPVADAFLFRDCETDGLRFSQPSSGRARVNIIVLHVSRNRCAWRAAELDSLARAAGIDVAGPAFLLARRDSTEAWYARDVREGPPADTGATISYAF